MKYNLLTLLLVLLPSVAQAEEEHSHNHNFELGTMVGPAYLLEEGHWVGSFHTHGVWFIPESPVGLGLGYERLIGGHAHDTLSIVANFHVWNGFILGLAPGITFDDGDVSASFHIETGFAFEVDSLHIGPMFEVALDKHDIHMTPGLHIGMLL